MDQDTNSLKRNSKTDKHLCKNMNNCKEKETKITSKNGAEEITIDSAISRRIDDISGL